MFDVVWLMLRTGILTEARPAGPMAAVAQEAIQKTLGRALCIRHLDAGSCNGCELEVQALHNPYYNLEGAGIKFVASPRHADLLLVTGPVTVNMEDALKRTYEAMPDPKVVIAVGDCGACGGIFGKSYASRGSVADVIPVHRTIPGCPPDPAMILAGILDIVVALPSRGSLEVPLRRG
jgi:Ni,Fe-hydrogenase III small subunit